LHFSIPVKIKEGMGEITESIFKFGLQDATPDIPLAGEVLRGLAE